MTMNRIHNATNPWQGKDKRVLCVCSAGLLRSPTAANVIHKHYGHNTRAAGLEGSFALICVDSVLLHWAEEIVCMDSYQEYELMAMLDNLGISRPIKCLHIDDSYGYMDASLVNFILERYN